MSEWAIWFMCNDHYEFWDGPFATISDIPIGCLQAVMEDPDYSLIVARAEDYPSNINEKGWWKDA